MPHDAIDFLAAHWLPWSIWLLVATGNLAKQGTFPRFVRVDSKYLPIVAVVAPQLVAVLLAIQSGASWSTSAIRALEVSVWTMGLYDVVTKAFPTLAEKAPWLAWLVAYVPRPTPES